MLRNHLPVRFPRFRRQPVGAANAGSSAFGVRVAQVGPCSLGQGRKPGDDIGMLGAHVVALAHVGEVTGGGGEQATFAAYALTLPFVPPATLFLALKEKTRWALGVVVVGAFGIAVMTARLQQIWNLGG